jgi:subtilase family serine protease
MELLRTRDIVALEYAQRPMPRYLHGLGLTYACVDQVSDSRSTQIVRDESLIFVPLGTRLNAEFEFNTCLDPFTPEVFCVEDPVVRKNFVGLRIYLNTHTLSASLALGFST